eukprot:Pgem_evm1s6465
MKFFSLVTLISISGHVLADRNFEIGLKTLFLSSSANPDQEKLAITKLQSLGASFDVVRVVDDNDKILPNFDLDKVLYDAKKNPKYSSIILMHYNLPVKRDNGNWDPALSQEQQNDLDIYQQRFGVRKVSLFSNANVHNALIEKVSPMTSKLNMEFSKNTAGEYAVKNFKSNIKEDAKFKLGNEHIYQDGKDNDNSVTQIYWNSVGINTAVSTVGEITPFMNIKNQDIPSAPDNIGAFLIKRPKQGSDGRDFDQEEMHFTFTQSGYHQYGLVLTDVWFTWVTKGIFLGQRRLVLNTHIDDLFISTQSFAEKEKHRALPKNQVKGYDPEADDEVPSFRVTADDMLKLKNWQQTYRASLPKGSNFTIEHAVNAQGWNYYENQNPFKFGYDTAALGKLETKIKELQDDFLWVSHTWSHMDLLCVESKCVCPTQANTVTLDSLKQKGAQLNCVNFVDNPDCKYSREAIGNDDTRKLYNLPEYPDCGYSPHDYITMELTRNQKWALNSLFDKDEAKMNSAKNFSPNSIVTPRISGLNYTVAIKAMLEAGIYTAVGDNSRTDLKPVNPYHGFNAKAKLGTGGAKSDTETFKREVEELKKVVPGREGLLVIPRFATRIYFDCTEPDENNRQHNSFYGPNCYGNGLDVKIAPYGYKCNKDSIKYPKELTFDQMIEIEGFENARNLLAYRTDPYMFHQANLHFYTKNIDGSKTYDGKDCLLSRWIKSVLGYVHKYNTFPIISHKMDDLERFYRDRMARDECKVEGSIQYENLKPKIINLQSNSKMAKESDCPAKLTITPTEGADNVEFLKYNAFKASETGATQVEIYGVDTTHSYTVNANWPVKDNIGAPTKRTPYVVPPTKAKEQGKKKPNSSEAAGFAAVAILTFSAPLMKFLF